MDSESKVKRILKFILKVLLFVSLFGIFFIYYVPGVVENFSNKTTTFHIQNAFVQAFEVPSVIICYNMGYKVSKTYDYNITTAWDFMVEQDYKNSGNIKRSVKGLD